MVRYYEISSIRIKQSCENVQTTRSGSETQTYVKAKRISCFTSLSDETTNALY